ncbi:GH12567 [Drosophila grimshawi]|uniref:Odorant receptor n=1 Tax=Drosophila grimshawi TaxID=7222 RepID=B4K2Q5_DROGR|nr:GH12567 [Drosophila grimshawi]
MPLAKMDSIFKYANFFYSVVGIEPYTKTSRSSVASHSISPVFLGNIITLSVNMFGEMGFVLVAFATGEHILEAIMDLSYIGFVFVGIIKIMSIWQKKPALSHIIWELEKLFPCDKAAQSAYNLDKYLNSCLRISFIFSILYTVLTWTYNLFDITEYCVYDLWLGIREVPHRLPYPVYIPWHWQEHWSYYVMLIYQDFAACVAAAGQVATDLLICALTTLIVMHFDYLARTIEKQVLSGDWSKDSRVLLDVVQYHERLLLLSNQLNEVFGVPLLMNLLISSAFSISVAAYNQNWNYADVRYRRSLILIIARSQNPVYLKATVLMTITRATMTELLQLSYKFFALLRTMYAG